MSAGALLHPVEAAGIEAAKGGSAFSRDQRPTPRFPSENGAPICPGESRRVRSIWSFFGPLGPLARRERRAFRAPRLSSGANALAYYCRALVASTGPELRQPRPGGLYRPELRLPGPGGLYRARGAHRGCRAALVAPLPARASAAGPWWPLLGPRCPPGLLGCPVPSTGPSFGSPALVASTVPEVPTGAAGLPWWPSTGPSFGYRTLVASTGPEVPTGAAGLPCVLHRPELRLSRPVALPDRLRFGPWLPGTPGLRRTARLSMH